MATRTSTRQCSFCGQRFGKSGIARHLKSCKEKAGGSEGAVGAAGRHPKKASSFHMVVEGRHRPEYWMHLEVPAKSQLLGLDGFLRETWLECCWHLSAFTVGDMAYFSEPMEEYDDKSMKIALSRLLASGMRFAYEYDFGTTTHLALRIIAEGEMTGQDIQVLARNDAPVLLCGECGLPAVEICQECSWEGEGLLCDECTGKHGCEEKMFLPVVNSPRTGMCAYSGETDSAEILP